MKKLLYIGYINGESYGDEVAFYLLKSHIENNYPNIQVSLYNADAVKYKLPRNINEYNFIVIGGGTCLSNLCRPFADCIAIQLSKQSIPYGMFGSGVLYERVRNQAGNVCMQTIDCNIRTKGYIEKASFIAVRDEAARNYMHTLVPNKNIRVLYDPGLSISYPKLPIQNSGKPTIGINLVGVNNQNCLGAIACNFKAVINNVIEFVKQHRDIYNFIFIPFNTTDHLYIQTLTKLGVYCCKYTSVENITGIIQNAHIVIGHRVHADITAAAYGIPFVSITYTKPNANFLDHINYKYRLSPKEMELYDNLVNMVKEVEKEKDHIKTHLLKEATKARETYIKEANNLCQLIESL